MGIAKNYVSRYTTSVSRYVSQYFITLMLGYFFIHFIEFNKSTMLIELTPIDKWILTRIHICDHLFEPIISILGGKNVLLLTDKEALFNVAYYFDRQHSSIFFNRMCGLY